MFLNNVIWIDILSVCKSLDLDEIEELRYLGKHPSLDLRAREIDFHFSESYSEKTLCITELNLYLWLEHLSFSHKANLRDIFISNFYTHLRRKVKFQFREIPENDTAISLSKA
ncbi:MAG: hypothetical protein IPO86_10155 [Saprospiraceae bacterium]|nr:hypothetical protein [Saprospiraceae bacterium]